MEIMLREFLGYTVDVISDFPETTSTITDLGINSFDIGLEAWVYLPNTLEYQRYIVEEKTVELIGPIGYPGRTEVYVTGGLANAEPLSTFHSFWKQDHLFPQLNVLRFGDVNLSAMLGETFPQCSEEWCSKGEFEGYWVPAQCEREPRRCALMLHGTSYIATGYYEQLAANHNLSVILTYVGWGLPWLVKQLVDTNKSVLFVWSEPDPIMPLLGPAKVSFPDFEFGCKDYTPDPFGTSTCGSYDRTLQKVVRREVRQKAPEAFFAADRMHLSADNMWEMLANTVDGGGTLGYFESACAFVKKYEAALVEDMAPPCIRSPKANPVIGDLVFNPSLFACRPITEQTETRSSSACLQPAAGTPDRSATRVTLARRSHLSHDLASTVLEILLKDIMLYDVWLVNVSALPASDWGSHMAESIFDIDVENSHVDHNSPAYLEYVTQRGLVLNPGAIGYASRSGLFILPHTQAKNEFASFWHSYGMKSQVLGSTGLDFYRFSDTDLRLRLQALVGADFPVCGPPAYPWCGAGVTGADGFYVPPACQDGSVDCLVVFASSPELDTGYFEQLTRNLELRLVYAYLGVERLGEFVRNASQAKGKDLLFYGREPDPLLASTNAVRVSFPDFAQDCDRGYLRDPRNGTVACDRRSFPSEKLLGVRLGRLAPEIEYIMKHLSLTMENMRTLMRAYEASMGGAYNVTCKWVRENLPSLRKTTIPTCLSTPRPLEEVRVGDEIFQPEEGACLPVSCAPNQVITIVWDSVVCRTCGEGLLPNGNQTDCVACPPGSSPEPRASGLVECTCDAGTSRFGSSDDSCRPCAAGTYADAAHGASDCLNCSAGTYSSAGSIACLPCPKGTATARLGAAVCERCSMDGFQETAGATACNSCGQGMATPYPGAESESLCGCLEGTFRLDPFSPCRVCPGGMTCAAGSDLSNFFQWRGSMRDPNDEPAFPRLQAGYMSFASDPLSVYQCSGTNRCPGGLPGTCGPKLLLGVVACGRCSKDFYWDGQVCADCAAATRWVYPLPPALIMPVLVAVMYRISRDEAEMWGSWRNCMASMGLLLLNSFQAFSIVLSANLPYSNSLGNWIEGLSFSQDPMLIFRPQCSGLTSFQAHLVVRSLVPVALLVTVVLIHLASHLLARLSGQPDRAMNRDRSANVYFSLIFAFFTALSSVALTTFMCSENPNGRATLLADRSVHCYDEDWRVLAAIAGVALSYVAGFGSLFCWASIVAPGKFRDRAFQRRWKFLFVKFSPDAWWWALCFCGKGLLGNLGFTFIKSGFLQLFWVMLVTLCYAFMVVQHLPWRHRRTMVMDLFSSFAIILFISLVAFIHASMEAVNDLESSVHIVLVLLVLAPLLAAACLLSLEVRSQRDTSVQAAFEDELREHYRALSGRILTEDQAVKAMSCADDWARWHTMRALRVVSTTKQAKRLTDGRIVRMVSEPLSSDGVEEKNEESVEERDEEPKETALRASEQNIPTTPREEMEGEQQPLPKLEPPSKQEIRKRDSL